MIVPAFTSWPSPTFTPRRWPTLSRPFFELEPAFLCAMAVAYDSFLLREPRGDGLASVLAVSPRAGLPSAFALGALESAPALESALALAGLAPERVDLAAGPDDFWGAGACVRRVGVVPVARAGLAVPLLDAAACLRSIFECNHLVAAVLADYFGADHGIGYERPPDRGIGSVRDQEHALERDRLPRLDLEPFDLELRSDLDAVLLSAGLNDCVHGSSGMAAPHVAIAAGRQHGTRRLLRARTRSLGVGLLDRQTSGS